MNGGGPLASPLRALRHAPVIVDDLGPIPRLAAAAQAAMSDGLPLDVEERVRWTRAWTVACQGVLHERGAIGTVPPWTVPLPVSELPTLKGDPERRRLGAALALLRDAGLLTFGDGGRVATLTEAGFVEHRAGLEVDWGELCRAARYKPASLLVARALADLVVPADGPTPVTLSELAGRTGYAPKQIRTALRRLTEARVVRTSESAGMATQYCFDIGAIPTQLQPRLAGSPEPPRQPAPVQPNSPGAGRAVALRLTLNGVTLSLGPGLAPHVELGPDGVPHLTFDPPSDGAGPRS